MESTKYQVFISSTYSDLLKERRRVLDILLMADCIPAGMENFVATDDEQFSVIKKVIDLCDYYILILGKRYGSVNEATGISYTEMEYNYAIDKGIPVLVFVLDDSVEVDDDKIEKDDIKKGKLAIAIMQAKNEIKRPGWHRGNDEEKERMLKQIKFLQAENEDLRKQISSFGVVKKDIDFEEAFYGKEIVLHFTEKVFVFTSNTVIDKKTIKTTLDNLFKFVSLRITGIKKISEFKDAISSFQGGYYVNEQDALIVRNKFEQLNLIESFVGKDDVEMIKLTDFGKGIMNELNE